MSTAANTSGAIIGANVAARIVMAVRLVGPAIVELAGLAALSYGSYLAWTPLGYIVPGAIILALSIVADVRTSAAMKAEKKGESK
jgi:hypothetical protein